ncbi:MAG: FHA domain-containing protein [Phormidesmis sp.]
MINCPNCNHQNPDGALQCEACYTPLPSLANCPHCNATIQADASFCGQCGSDLREESPSPLPISTGSTGEATAGSTPPDTSVPVVSSATSTDPDSPSSALKTQNFLNPDESSGQPDIEVPELVVPDPLIASPSLETSEFSGEASGPTSAETSATSSDEPDIDPGVFISTPSPNSSPPNIEPDIEPDIEPEAEPLPTNEPVTSAPASSAPPSSIPTPAPARQSSATQLQTFSARLRQVQTGTAIEIPRGLSVVRIGKPNDHTPPDIDVSGFPDSEVVSRTHANLRVEGDTYYLEDVGSSNGTYINGLPLPVGNRHRLRPGDRISLGKGDKVSFVFEMAS